MDDNSTTFMDALKDLVQTTLHTTGGHIVLAVIAIFWLKSVFSRRRRSSDPDAQERARRHLGWQASVNDQERFRRNQGMDPRGGGTDWDTQSFGGDWKN